jgi:hypothetical protein
MPPDALLLVHQPTGFRPRQFAAPDSLAYEVRLAPFHTVDPHRRPGQPGTLLRLQSRRSQ